MRRHFVHFNTFCFALLLYIRVMNIEKTLFADGFDKAIVGLIEDWNSEVIRICYSKSKMIDCMMEEDMSFEDAIEFLEFNVWGAYVGEGTPLYIEDLNGVTRDEVEEHLEMYDTGE